MLRSLLDLLVTDTILPVCGYIFMRHQKSRRIACSWLFSMFKHRKSKPLISLELK